MIIQIIKEMIMQIDIVDIVDNIYLHTNIYVVIIDSLLYYSFEYLLTTSNCEVLYV